MDLQSLEWPGSGSVLAIGNADLDPDLVAWKFTKITNKSGFLPLKMAYVSSYIIFYLKPTLSAFIFTFCDIEV
jgi:hypothetical protein